jgi:TatD DNase family protein
VSLFRLVDSHCHLDFDVFHVDRDEVVNRAREAGVTRIVNPGVDIETSEAVVKLAEKIPELYAAVGIHPNEVQSLAEILDGTLEHLLSKPKVTAIGEIGLDYYRERTAKDLQIKAFEGQLNLAKETGLPVIVHNRAATEDTLQILSAWVAGLRVTKPDLARRPGVLHSFSGTLDEAEQAVDMGFLIGITGPVTFPKAVELQQIVSILPLESLLVETDAPFLTPHPWRGKRNEPGYVKYTVEKIAGLREIDFEQVAEKTTANAIRIFGWGEPF